MTAEHREEHPQPKEPERFDAQGCLRHSTPRHSPYVFPLLSTEIFRNFIPGSSKWGELTFPGMEYRITERVSGIVRNWNSDKVFADAEHEGMAEVSQGIVKKFLDTDISLLKRTSNHNQRDFDIVTQSDGYYMVVSHPQGDGEERQYVAVNLTKMNERNPDYVRQTLEEIYVRKGAHDVIEETHKEVLLHEQKRKDYELVHMLDVGPEKRDEELGYITNFLETVGGFDRETIGSINHKNSLYKPPQPTAHPRPESNYLAHVQDCPAATLAEKAVKDKLPGVWKVLDKVTIKPIDDPVLKNPLEHTERSLRSKEKQINQYEQLAEFLDEETSEKDFPEFISDLGTKLPDIQRQFAEFQSDFDNEGKDSFEEKVIRSVRLTGVFGRPSINQINTRITVADNPSLQEITRIIVLKYIQDQLKHETTTNALAAEQIKDFNPLIAGIAKTIKTEGGKAETKRAEIQEQRDKMNRVLEAVNIEPEEIGELEQRLAETVVDREKTFFLAFHMYRLQKAGSIDTTSPVFAQAVKTYFSQRGEEALEAIQAAA